MSVIPPSYNGFKIYQGATWQEVVAFKDEDGNRISITDWDIVFKAATPAGEVVIDLSVGQGITINAADKEFTLELTAEETAELTAEVVSFQIDCTDTDDIVSRRLIGEIPIYKSL